MFISTKFYHNRKISDNLQKITNAFYLYYFSEDIAISIM